MNTLLLFFAIYVQFINPDSLMMEIFVLKEFFLWGLIALPAHFATFAFSMNAAFIEKQLITPLPVFKLLQAKYRLYCILSIVLFMLLLPTIFLGVKIFELVAALLFSTGFASFGLFLTSLVSYKPFDIKASYYYNYQGVDGGNYFAPLLVMAVALGFTALFYWLFNEIITLIILSLIGLVFILLNKIWLGKISEKFEKTKYYRLERFREK
jgi:hypothetical protein